MKRLYITLAILFSLIIVPTSANKTEASALTYPQIQAIVALLQSFGADQKTITAIQNALGGAPATSITASSTTPSGITTTASSNASTTSQVITITNPTQTTVLSTDAPAIPYTWTSATSLKDPWIYIFYAQVMSRPIMQGTEYASGLSKDSGTITTAVNFPDGQYFIKVCDEAPTTPICGTSATFTMITPTGTSTPIVTPTITSLVASASLNSVYFPNSLVGLYGSGFDINSYVLFTASSTDAKPVTINPTSYTPNSLSFFIPANASQGNYTVQVGEKGQGISNEVVLSVISRGY